MAKSRSNLVESMPMVFRYFREKRIVSHLFTLIVVIDLFFFFLIRLHSMMKNLYYFRVIRLIWHSAVCRDRMTNADTYTKADSARISPSFVNMGLARNDLCVFYWINIRMMFFFQKIFRRFCSLFF